MVEKHTMTLHFSAMPSFSFFHDLGRRMAGAGAFVAGR